MRLHLKILRKVVHFVGKLLFSPEYIAVEVKELPSELDNGVVYVVRDGDEPDSLILKCPCGCGEIIYLNLLTDTKPVWKFNINRFGLISIVPSVWRTVRCRSHFFLTKGRIIQCSNFSSHI